MDEFRDVLSEVTKLRNKDHSLLYLDSDEKG